MSVITDPIAEWEAAEAAHWKRVGHPEPSAIAEGGEDESDPWDDER